MSRDWLRVLAVVWGLFYCSAPVKAADLVIGMQGSTSSVDPHWMTSPANR
jgi:hypothetical protein